MAHQFFTKTQPSRQSSSTSPPPLPPLYGSYNSRQSRPPIHPPPLILPQSSSKSVSKPASGANPEFQPVPYPHSITGYPTPHPYVAVEPVSTAHIPSLSRITGLLLPIRYPNSFYTATITDPVVASLSRVVVYHDHPVAPSPAPGSATESRSLGKDKVIGGIRCRLEQLDISPKSAGGTETCLRRDPTNLYIQTLHLLSPYRGSGIATSLLNSLLYSFPLLTGPKIELTNYQVSQLVKHYNIRTVTAHVHEANEEALKWYMARGFQVEDGVIEGYYRRLKPSGAKVVRLTLRWEYEDGQLVDTGNNGPSENFALSNPANKDDNATDGVAVQDDIDDEDDDWEKVEAEDEDEDVQGQLGVQPINESRSGNGASRKRKADEGEPRK